MNLARCDLFWQIARFGKTAKIHFAKAPPLARIFHELPFRDREDGRATGQPQGLGPLTVRRAGCESRGRPEGRPYCSRSLRSAQSRKRVPSFAVAAGDS